MHRIPKLKLWTATLASLSICVPTRLKPHRIVLVALVSMASLSACTADMTKTMADGLIDGMRIGVHGVIDKHFGQVVGLSEQEVHDEDADELF